MKKILRRRNLLVLLIVVEILFFWQIRAEAHCDTLDGPVVKAARSALESDDVTPLVKWVSVDDEQAIREAFQKTLKVRQLGGEAGDLQTIIFLKPWFASTAPEKEPPTRD
jgi:hypothetical protein